MPLLLRRSVDTEMTSKMPRFMQKDEIDRNGVRSPSVGWVHRVHKNKPRFEDLLVLRSMLVSTTSRP